jgi:hypothetical protein
MAYKLTFVGAQPNEQTPAIAVYAVDSAGRIGKKIATADKGQITLAKDASGIVAIGPDVPDPSTLDAQSLMKVRLADQTAIWTQSGITIPAQWWRNWLGILICLAGKASRCFPFVLENPVEVLKANALNARLVPPLFPPFCTPLCNGVVEVWENTCCCWPILIFQVPSVIANLRQFLAENPVMFPPIPKPDPGPVDRVLERNVNLALASGKVDPSFAPSTDLAAHLHSLETMTAQDALQYIQVNPSLWPFFCHCSSAKLGETVLQPDGTFHFCYFQFPFLLPNCRRSYFYKVKQFINGVWTYVYDGAAAHQYFNADVFANLNTFRGLTCNQTPPPPGNDIVALQAIGLTNTWNLNSHWSGADGSGKDLTQVGDVNLGGPPTDAGLLNPNGAPWGGTPQFLLYFDPGMKALGATYYRLSVVQADGSGNPVGGATPQAIDNPVSWSYFQTVSGQTAILSQSLGPNTVGASNSLFLIPYNADHEWLGDQFHQYLDTTKLPNTLSSTGTGNGQYLLVLEVFDSAGKRLVPQTAPSPGPNDVAKPFNFIRLLTSTTTSNVEYKSLTHMIWVDNRPVVGEIDSFAKVVNGVTTTGSEECQFLTAPGTALFEVGFRAYHRVLGDSAPAPHPSRTFMSSFQLDWEEGLNGPSGILDSGLDVDQPLSRDGGSPEMSPGVSFATLLGTQTSCAFAITLHVWCKHTDGIYHLSGYDVEIPSAVALSKT